MNVLVELRSTVTEARLVSFKLPGFLETLDEESKIKYINNYVQQEQVKFLATTPGTISSLSFTHEIKDMDYTPDEEEFV